MHELHMNNTRIIVYDPGMCTTLGHHYTYNTLFHQAFLQKGLSPHYLFGVHCPPELLQEFPIALEPLPWLSHTLKPCAAPLSVDDCIKAVRQNVVALHERLQAHCSASSLVFSHSLDSQSLLILALWYQSLPEDTRPALSLNMMININTSSRCRGLLMAARDALAGARLRLFGATEAIVSLLSEIFSIDCQMFPTPLPGNIAQFIAQPTAAAPVFTIVGAARQEKNIHLLASAIHRYLLGNGQGRFTINMTPQDTAMQDILLTLHDISRNYPENLRISFTRLSEHDYFTEIGHSDAVVIPYDSASYTRFRPSGVAIEATALGVPVICAKQSFMEEELGPLDNGSLFLDSITPKALANAFFEFDKTHIDRKNKALRRAHAYRGKHNTENAMTMLLH